LLAYPRAVALAAVHPLKPRGAVLNSAPTA